MESKMKNKGQVSVFIILGIIVAVILVFALRSTIVINQSVSVEIEPIKEHVESCVREKAFDGLEILEKQGGIINVNDGLSVYGGDRKVVYWYDDVIKIPSLSEMERELGSYVEEKIEECLDFGLFDDYEIEVLKDMEVNVKISESVNLDIVYPLDIERNSVSYKVEFYNVEVNSEIKELYELSKEIMKKENSDLFLEEKTLDLLTLYGIPISGAGFDCEEKIWVKSELEMRVKDLLSVGLPFIRVEETKYESYEDEEMRMFIWDVTSKYYDDEVETLFYQQWPFEFDVNPSKGELVKGDVFRQNWKFGVFCLNYYHFVYDLEFPVVFRVSNGEEEFYFATKVKIISNKARENDNVFFSENEEFCKNGKEMKVLGADSVNFICGEFMCSREVENEKVEVPVCSNALVVGNKEGYVSDEIWIDTYEEEGVGFNLEKIKKLEVEFRDQNNKLIDGSKYKVVAHLESDKFESYSVYPEMDEIELVEGDYNVNLMLMKKDRMKFPGKRVKVCIGIKALGSCLGEEREYVIPTLDLENVVVGGAEYEYSFTEEDLKNEGLRFYVYEDEVRNTDEMVNVMGKLKEYGKKVNKVEVK